MQDRNLLPSFEKTGIDTVVFAMNEDLRGAAIEIATTLRKEGQSVDVVLENKKTKWIFKHADRIKASYVAIIAPDEYEKGEVSIKNLDNGEQVSVEIGSLADWTKNN